MYFTFYKFYDIIASLAGRWTAWKEGALALRGCICCSAFFGHKKVSHRRYPYPRQIT